MFELFLSFAKIGVMTFGGGLAMLPMLERELVDNKGWVTRDALMDYYAIGQCTPGIIAINVSTFVGKKQKGIPGAIAATLGMLFPSIVIISVLAAFFSNFADIPAVQHAFAGARTAVCILVLNSVIKLFKSNVKNYWITALVYIVTAVLVIVFKVSPILVVLAAAAIGIIYGARKGGRA